MSRWSQYLAPGAHLGMVRWEGQEPMFSKWPTMPWWTTVSAWVERVRERVVRMLIVFIVVVVVAWVLFPFLW